MEEIHRKRVVMIPAPFEGHLPSMMNLASYISSFNQFKVTIVRAQYNFYDISDNFPHIQFLSIPDGLSEADLSSIGLVDFVLKLNSVCEPLFKELLTKLDDVVCIIHDEFVYFPRAVAEELNLHKMVYSSSCAATSISRCVLLEVEENGSLPPREARSQLEKIMPQFQPFRFRDLPATVHGSMERLILLYENVSNRGTSSGIIHNTSNCLESSFITSAQEKWGIPVYPVGPLYMSVTATPCPSLFAEERHCLEWLEKQETNSVIYISMGSLAVMTEAEVVEMAWGLVHSKQPFLWAIRPGSISGHESFDSFPEEFNQIVENEKGCVVKWAPQKEVLRHRAVGGIWNHVGWNSSLESIGSGVPMICRPYSGDQRVNTRLMTHVWQTAFEVEGDLDKEAVEVAMRRLFVDPEGEEMRRKAIFLKEEVEASVGEGGSSYNALNDLVNAILQF